MTTTNPLGNSGQPGTRAFERPGTLVFVGQLVAIALVYFALAKLGLTLASINPSTSPIWPPSGFALAAVLLWGVRVWPAIFVAAFVVNVMTTGSARHLACDRARQHARMSRHAAVWSIVCPGAARPSTRRPAWCALPRSASRPGPLIAATLGAASLALAGSADWSEFAPIWLTWWLGDAAGAVVIAPVIVLWARSEASAFKRGEGSETAGVLASPS